MGGPVRVVYARGRSASHTGQVKKPLELFSRKARTIAQNPANIDRTWEDAVNLMNSYPPTLPLPSTAPSTRSRDQQRRFYLPIDVVYPRCLELRGTINTKSLYRNVSHGKSRKAVQSRMNRRSRFRGTGSCSSQRSIS